MAWLGDHLWAAWLVLAAALGVAEMVSLDLVLIMVAVGAFVGALAALASLPLALQILLAAGSSAAMLALVRPNLIKKLHSGPDLVTGTGKLVGQQGVVTEELSAHHPGRVKVGGPVGGHEHALARSGRRAERVHERGVRDLLHQRGHVHPVGELMP